MGKNEFRMGSDGLMGGIYYEILLRIYISIFLNTLVDNLFDNGIGKFYKSYFTEFWQPEFEIVNLFQR